MDKIRIFDTTLRDGEQSPGASMNQHEKLRIAVALERLKVDIIEAGFPAASPGDFESVRLVASTIRDCEVCGLSRALRKDIETVASALKDAKNPRIHTFIATSSVHMENKLRKTPEQTLEMAEDAVRLAARLCDNVEFSPEDATRAEIDFLCKVVERVIALGARTINIPDTVGYAFPEEFGELIATLRTRVPNSDKAVFSAHCHDDLGLAVANSLAAVLNGAQQVECTINGLGERAGNAALEEIVMSLKTRKDFFRKYTGVDTTQILSTSRLVSGITGFAVQPNKAIVGANAFAHASGIHQDGVLKYRQTYEIMRAEDVGWKNNRIVLSKLSGRNAFNKRLLDLGIKLEDSDSLDDAFARFKELADKKTEIFDEDLQAIVSEGDSEASRSERFRFASLEVIIGGAAPQARISVQVDGKLHHAVHSGDGAVDASFKAIEKIAASGSVLKLYSVNNITTGSDAQGEVSVRLSGRGQIVNGLGTDTDIVVASAKAYINALNRMYQDRPMYSQLQI